MRKLPSNSVFAGRRPVSLQLRVLILKPWPKALSPSTSSLGQSASGKKIIDSRRDAKCETTSLTVITTPHWCR
jgi:hypothetical protein